MGPEKYLIEAVLKNELILDIGGSYPWTNNWITSEYRSILEKKAYCVDFQAECKPHIIGDVRNLPFKDNSVDGIICIATLEHVDKPFQAVHELYRVLSPGGELLLYVPWVWPYHAVPQDCFRYSIDGIRSLCDEFSSIKIVPKYTHGLPPNRILCGLHFLIPPIPWVKYMLFRIIGMPIYLIYRP